MHEVWKYLPDKWPTFFRCLCYYSQGAAPHNFTLAPKHPFIHLFVHGFFGSDNLEKKSGKRSILSSKRSELTNQKEGTSKWKFAILKLKNEKDHNINCSACQFTICFCLCLFWLGGNFKLCCLIYLFFQNLTFQNWYSAYLHVRLIHRLLRYWYIWSFHASTRLDG